MLLPLSESCSPLKQRHSPTDGMVNTSIRAGLSRTSVAMNSPTTSIAAGDGGDSTSSAVNRSCYAIKTL